VKNNIIVEKGKSMENNLSLDKEIDLLMNKKLRYCECNPCACPEQTKNIYFQEMKAILARFNKEYLGPDLMRISLFNQSIQINIY